MKRQKWQKRQDADGNPLRDSPDGGGPRRAPPSLDQMGSVSPAFERRQRMKQEQMQLRPKRQTYGTDRRKLLEDDDGYDSDARPEARRMAIHSKADHSRPWRGNNDNRNKRNRFPEKDDGTRLPPDLNGGRQTGVVIRWFNDQGLGTAGTAGYGWIDPDDGSSQLFCHARQVEGLTKDGKKARSIVEGTRVEYAPVVAERDPSKFEAVNVTGINNKPLPVYARGEIAGYREDGVRPNKVLRVTNISWWVTEQELKEHFEQIGPVVVAKIEYEGGYKGKQKKSLGRGTVRMCKQKDANVAEWKLHKTMLRDRRIYVQAWYRLRNRLAAEEEAREALFDPKSGVYNKGYQLRANWNEETVDEMYEDLPPLLEWT